MKIRVTNRAGKSYKFKGYRNLEIHHEQFINQGVFQWSNRPSRYTIKITDKYGDKHIYYDASYEVLV